MKRIFIALGALALLAFAVLTGGPVLQQNQRRGEMQALRDSLQSARFSADSCKVALTRTQKEFFAFDLLVDSLRYAVHAFEDPDQGGVPQEEYSIYLEAFEEYNQAVDGWEALAENLRAEEAACRILVEDHNRLGDSLRGIANSGTQDH